jgi:prevent-host-death family protein
MRMGLREANQSFSKAMKAVKRGKEVVLTERGKPIAVIKPLERKEDQEAVIRRLEADGLLRPALKRGPMPKPSWKAIRVKGKLMSQTIRQERDER